MSELGKGNNFKKTSYGLLFSMIAGVLILLWLYYKYINVLAGGSGTNYPGTFGDMFGGANALFSGLTFAALIFSVYLQRKANESQTNELAMQRKQLELQMEEMKLAREEQENQRKELEIQNATLKGANSFQVLTTVVTEYRSPEMYFAVKRFWDHHRKYGENFIGKFAEIRDSETLHVDSISSPASQITHQRDMEKVIMATIDFQRRRLTSFYTLLASYNELKMFPDEMIFTFFTSKDLRLIKDVLVPIEESMSGLIPGAKVNRAQMDRMMNLYKDCVKWEGGRITSTSDLTTHE